MGESIVHLASPPEQLQRCVMHRYAALQEEESEDQLKPPPIYITDVKNTSPLIQLLEQITKQQYEIKALADNQVKVQSKTSECYRTIIKALAEKRTERSYRIQTKIRTPWNESASELCRPSDHRLSAKSVPTFVDRGCHVVRVMDPYGRNLSFLDRKLQNSVKKYALLHQP
jgi:hypothetical protein